MKTIQEINTLICANMGVTIEYYEGLDLSGQFNLRKDNLKVLQLTSKAFKMVPNSPAQIKVRQQIDKIKLKYA